MECPYCGCELIQIDTYGRYLNDDKYREINGEILTCPNHEGFEDQDECRKYLEDTGYKPTDKEDSTWMDKCCESSVHNVSGSFYTDKNGCLYNGYHC